MSASSKSSPSESTSSSTTNSSSSSFKSRGNGKNKRRNPPLSPSPSFYLPSAQAVRRPLSPSPSLPIPNRSQEAYSPSSHGRHGQIYRPPTPRSPSSPTRARSPVSVPPPPPRRPSVTGATMDYSLSMAEILALSSRPYSPYSPYSPYPPNDPQYTLAVHYEPLAGMPFSKVQLEPPPPRPNSPVPHAIGPIGPAGEHVRIWTPQPRRFPVTPPGHSQRPRPTTRRSFSSPPARPSLSRSVTTPGTTAPTTTSPPRETYGGRGFGQHSRLPSTDSITFFPLLDSDNDPPDQQSVTGEDEHPHPQSAAGGSGGEGQGKQSFFTTLRNLTWLTAPRSAAPRSDKKRARDQVENERQPPANPTTPMPSIPSAPLSRPQSPPLDYTQAQRQAITLLADRPGTKRVSPERRYKSPATTGLTLARTISLGRAEFEMGDRGSVSPAPLTGVDSTDKAPWSDTMAESTHSV